MSMICELVLIVNIWVNPCNVSVLVPVKNGYMIRFPALGSSGREMNYLVAMQCEDVVKIFNKF